MPNRSERRRIEREQKNKHSVATHEMMAAVRSAISEKIQSKRLRDEAVLFASGPVVKAIYAGLISIMSDDYGFTGEQCYELLSKLDEKVAFCLDNQDIVNEALTKTGIQIHFNDVIDRVVMETDPDSK